MKPRYKLLLTGERCLVVEHLNFVARRECAVQAMHPADIKAALHKKGFTQTHVANLAKRAHSRTGHAHKSAVSRVIAGDLKSTNLAQLIAKLIEIPVEQIWPGKYSKLSKQGKPLARKSRKPAAV